MVDVAQHPDHMVQMVEAERWTDRTVESLPVLRVGDVRVAVHRSQRVRVAGGLLTVLLRADEDPSALIADGGSVAPLLRVFKVTPGDSVTTDSGQAVVGRPWFHFTLPPAGGDPAPPDWRHAVATLVLDPQARAAIAVDDRTTDDQFVDDAPFGSVDTSSPLPRQASPRRSRTPWRRRT